jgi:hypothetical protein
MMSQLLDRLEELRGLPVLIGVVLVVLNFAVRLAVYAFGTDTQDPALLLFLFTDGNLLLHLGVIVALGNPPRLVTYPGAGCCLSCARCARRTHSRSASKVSRTRACSQVSQTHSNCGSGQPKFVLGRRPIKK